MNGVRLTMKYYLLYCYYRQEDNLLNIAYLIQAEFRGFPTQKKKFVGVCTLHFCLYTHFKMVLAIAVWQVKTRFFKMFLLLNIYVQEHSTKRRRAKISGVTD